MKRLLLFWFISLLSFFWFTNAWYVTSNLTCWSTYNNVWQGFICTPSYSFSSSQDYFNSVITCNSVTKVRVVYYKNWTKVYWPWTYFCNSVWDVINTNIYIDWGFDKVSFFSNDSNVTFWLKIDDPNYNENNVIPYWVSVFTWILTSIVSVVSEIIPYIIYIWLWVLVAVLWFIAIKRLLNWIRRKVFGNFKY